MGSLVDGLDVLLNNGRPAVNADAQLDDAPGLYFIGYSNPITGSIRRLGIAACKIARDAKRGGSSPRPQAPSGASPHPRWTSRPTGLGCRSFLSRLIC